MNRIFAAGEHGTIVIVQERDRKGTAIRVTEETLRAVRVLADGHVVAAGDKGMTVWSTDGDENWQKKPVQQADDLYALTPGAREGELFAAGASGAIYHTSNRGDSWERRTEQSREKDSRKPAVLALEQRAGTIWAVGEKGLFLKSTDNGRNWVRLGQERRRGWLITGLFIAAPLLAGVWPTASLIAYLRQRRREKNLKTQASARQRHGIAPKLVNDIPLEPGKKDCLGIEEIAETVAQFILSDTTEPGLTIAISGQWGSGKSSLMRRICSKLNKAGYLVVQYNAWHHERERRQLPSLLEKIRREATGKIRWNVRWQARRIRKFATPLAVSALAGLFLVPSFLRPVADGYTGQNWDHALSYVLFGRKVVVWRLDKIANERESGKDGNEDRLFGAVARLSSANVNVFAGWSQLYKTVAASMGRELSPAERIRLHSYGEEVNPLKSLSVSFMGKLMVAVALIGVWFRIPRARSAIQRLLEQLNVPRVDGEAVGKVSEYEKEFQELFEAFMDINRPVAIFIDDLDRCQREWIQEGLETISYITQTGKCYVVVACDPEVILSCVPGESEVQRRKYLEKIFNVTIGVPRMAAGNAKQLISDICSRG